MLQLGGSLVNKAVLSLRTSTKVGETVNPIFNPNNLKIEGFYVKTNASKDNLILVSQDIRENSLQGFIINDQEVLVEPEELVRLKEILKLDFHLLNMPVVTVGKVKLGKVNDYATESETLYVQKLYVGQSLLKSFSGGQLSIDRDQIIEITNKKIVVQDILQGEKAGAIAPA
ncbi:MAG TPA: hypothetical protein VLF39_02710 [Candidatus Saccharimonadales bacterium]|nr:hypothetical protein [Candidatus Saccharimonadales bacterium]